MLCIIQTTYKIIISLIIISLCYYITCCATLFCTVLSTIQITCAQVESGASVAVFGCGAVGLAVIQAARPTRTLALTHPLTALRARSLTLPAHSLTHTDSLTHCFTRSLARSQSLFTRSLTLTHSLPASLARPLAHCFFAHCFSERSRRPGGPVHSLALSRTLSFTLSGARHSLARSY